MKSTTAYDDQFLLAHTPEEEEAWRDLERWQSEKSTHRTDIASISLAASETNPAHVSVGAVIITDGGQHLVHLTTGGVHSYMTETVEPSEALDAAVVRGCMEEMGIVVQPRRYLGSTCHRGTMGRTYVWAKTTLWFECSVVSDGHLYSGEPDSAVVSIEPSSASALIWDLVRYPPVAAFCDFVALRGNDANR